MKKCKECQEWEYYCSCDWWSPWQINLRIRENDPESLALQKYHNRIKHAER